LKPFFPNHADAEAEGLIEAAPARARIRVLAIVLIALFALLAGRAGQLALAGAGLGATHSP